MKNYYHKYFEDYAEERVPNRDGKGTHIEHTYAGYYYRLGLNGSVKIALRSLYLLLGLAAAGCLLFGSTRTAHYNTMPYAAILQALTLLAVVWFIWVLLYYVLSPKDMTVYKYKSTALQMLRVSRYLSAAFLLNAFLTAVDMICFKAATREQAACLGAYLAGSILVFGLKMIEQSLPYERLSNDKKVRWYRKKMIWERRIYERN